MSENFLLTIKYRLDFVCMVYYSPGNVYDSNSDCDGNCIRFLT